MWFSSRFSVAVIAVFTGQKLHRQPHLCTSPSPVPSFPTTKFLVSLLFLHLHLPTHHEPTAHGARGSGFASKERQRQEERRGKRNLRRGFGSAKHEAGRRGSMKRAEYWRSKSEMSQDD